MFNSTTQNAARYQPGERVIYSDGRPAEVLGYASYITKHVKLCDDIGNQFSVHERELRKLTLDEQVRYLLDALDDAEQDVSDDAGREAWDRGGWVEVTRAIISAAIVSSEAKRQVSRMRGLDDSDLADADDVECWALRDGQREYHDLRICSHYRTGSAR